MDETTESNFTGGFAASIRADGDVVVREGGALAIVAGGDATLKEAGAGLCVVGGDASMAQAGAGSLFVGGSVEMHEAGIGQMMAMEATVADSRVGLLIGGKVTLERSEVMLGTAQAAALGAAAGALFFLLSRLVRRG
jgi:hypothetical protein